MKSVPTPRAIHEASRIMVRFAERTGLTSDLEKQRYLWTDAFAVCNLLGLAQATGEQRYTDLALQLVDQVHHVLGCFHTDDSRRGWLSGLTPEEGELHPTRGGLRIGKRLPERGADEPFDERLEWDRDGQYFHYLTKWMHALDQVSRWTGEPRFNTWARELAEVSHDAFTLATRNGRRMVWKMSTDLSRPLVPSMGHHDPLDGFITCLELRASSRLLAGAPVEPSLTAAVMEFSALIDGQDFATADPLGLGGLLIDASRVAQLPRLGSFADEGLLEALLAAALQGLSHYELQNDLRAPASRRLAFRELGLALGLRSVELIQEEMQTNQRVVSRGASARELLEALTRYVPLGSTVESFWLDPQHREEQTWSQHRDINEVMLATNLVPAGFLVLTSVFSPASRARP